jgi:MYXO-CTERM domain-containing protein
MRCFRAFLSLGLLLAAAPAVAEYDVFGLGNGQHGALRVQRTNVTINIATALTAQASSGSKTLTVADVSGFAAGELVLVLQLRADGPAPEAGVPAPIDLDATSAGRWEFARLEAVAPGVLSLTAPLVFAYSGPGSQVVRVPEHTSVHVQNGASLMAPPWNGSSGGVLVLLATDAVLNQGLISADGAGFPGGIFRTSSRNGGCTELNESEATGGANKGQGIFSKVPGVPTHGYGAIGNGAGGGNCEDGGGGGGGHGGPGGQGGFTEPGDGSRDVGGRGGGVLRYSPLSRLAFGGGGGAGAGSASGPSGSGGTSGGAGGGIIYLRARDFQGSQGRVTANGQSVAVSGNDGAGGGGAGGLISIRVEDRLDCSALEARGGDGGDNSDTKERGPGGGGGGGVVLLQGETIRCPASVASGLAGTSAAAEGSTYGATPTAEAQSQNQGVVTTLSEGLAIPGAPVWVVPAEGAKTVPLPRLEGTALARSSVQVFLDGELLGTVEADDSGAFSIQPATALTEGPHEVRAFSERLGLRSTLSEPRAFIVGLSPLEFQVGCGCGAAEASGGGAFALGLLLLLAARRRAPGGTGGEAASCRTPPREGSGKAAWTPWRSRVGQ